MQKDVSFCWRGGHACSTTLFMAMIHCVGTCQPHIVVSTSLQHGCISYLIYPSSISPSVLSPPHFHLCLENWWDKPYRRPPCFKYARICQQTPPPTHFCLSSCVFAFRCLPRSCSAYLFNSAFALSIFSPLSCILQDESWQLIAVSGAGGQQAPERGPRLCNATQYMLAHSHRGYSVQCMFYRQSAGPRFPLGRKLSAMVLRIILRDRWRVDIFLYAYIMWSRCFSALERLFVAQPSNRAPENGVWVWISLRADSSTCSPTPPFSRLAVEVEGAGLERLCGGLTFGRSWEAADVRVGQDVCKKQCWILFFRPQQLELSHSYGP